MSTELAKTKPAQESGNEVSTPRRFTSPRYWSVPHKDAYDLFVVMPGVSKEGLSVSLVDDQMTIIGRREDPVPDDWRVHRRELNNTDYRLRVRLNISVDQEHIDAHMEDGILSLKLPFSEEAKPRVIDVQ